MELIEVVPIAPIINAFIAMLGGWMGLIVAAYFAFVVFQIWMRGRGGVVEQMVTAAEWKEIRARRKRGPRKVKMSHEEWKAVKAGRR